MINRGSYMSAHVLLNLLNELGGKDKKSYRFPLNEFNKFSDTEAWMQDSLYHMTLKLH